LSDELIELGLLKPGGPDKAAGPAAAGPAAASAPGKEAPGDEAPGAAELVRGLLSLLSKMAPEAEELDSASFRSKLAAYSEQMTAKQVLDIDVIRSCIEDCETFFDRYRSYLSSRDSEFAGVIDMLRKALTALAGESATFSERLFVASDRLKKISELNDIRELKKVIAVEVRELRRVVLEKQEQDERSYANLTKQVGELRSKLESVRKEASSDPLTQVANRASFDRTIRQWIEQRKPFVLAMMDVDHFKTINDTHGHRVGDNVMICVAQWIRDGLRGTDLVARFGGDEFAVLLVDTNLRNAEPRVGRLLAEIARRSFAYTNKKAKVEVSFTVSSGLAEFSAGDTVEELIQRADKALYEAKKKRNHVSSMTK
jgi:diguanylate cyclase